MADKSKERPILFTKENRQKCVDGLKTQTRRIIKFKKIAKQTGCTKGKLFYSKTFNSWAVDGNSEVSMCLVKAPYAVGDRLYQLEPYQITLSCPNENLKRENVIGHYQDDGICFSLTLSEKESELFYKRKHPLRSTSARFMYKSLARYFYEVTAVRVEQVQSISGEDCLAEGIDNGTIKPFPAKKHEVWMTDYWKIKSECVNRFKIIWNSIHGPDAWAKNDWVWTIEFNQFPPDLQIREYPK